MGQRFPGRVALALKGLLGVGVSKPYLHWAWQQLEGKKKRNRVLSWSAKLKPTLDNVKTRS